MKNIFTSILMFFIVIILMGAIGLVGLIVWEELNGNLIMETSEGTEEVELFQTEDSEIADTSDNNDTIEKNIEVPKIKSTTNPLTELEESKKDKIKEPEINYQSLTSSKYFYSQLNQYSQIIYNALDSNKENMKSGTYKVNLGSSFSSILSKDEGQDMLGDYYQSAIEAYLYDNPDIFYLNPSRMYLNIETTTRGTEKTYNTYIDCGEEVNYFADEFSSKYDVQDAINAIENVRNEIISKKTGNAYNDIKMVHDYLIDNIEYDKSISKDNIYNIYGALVNHECVCEGYAEAFKYLLDGLGIESTLVIGKGTNSSGNSENHAWNYVQLDGNWYAIDVTWDDPIVIGGGTVSKENKYKYFLKGINTMNKDHFPSGRFTENGKLFSYPALSDKDY